MNRKNSEIAVGTSPFDENENFNGGTNLSEMDPRIISHESRCLFVRSARFCLHVDASAPLFLRDFTYKITIQHEKRKRSRKSTLGYLTDDVIWRKRRSTLDMLFRRYSSASWNQIHFYRIATLWS